MRAARRTLGAGGARGITIAWLTLLGVLVIGSAPAFGYTRLNLIAGGHPDGAYAGDGGPAEFAWLDDPSGVAVDATGNLYVADSHNLRVRRIGLNGRITTFAGNGRYGGHREGARATATPLYVPTDVATDGRGNLYVLVGPKVGPATRVLVVDGAGILRSFAGADTTGFSGDGGPALTALLDGPQSLATDGQGNVYIGEPARIRRVDANGIISTIAGTGIAGFSGDGGPATAAQLDWGLGLVVDRSGNLFVASGNRIRRIDAAGTITTIAGTGSRGFSGDGGPATLARLGVAGGLAVDDQGILYISDNNNRRIRTVDAGGTIRTFAGGGGPAGFGSWGPALRTRLSFPHDIAVDGRGLVFFTADHSVFRLEPSLTPEAAGRCTREAAREILERRRLGNAGSLADPVVQLLCGPFAGSGSQAMVVSLRTPGCGASIGWRVFRSQNGRWRQVFSTNRGALLTRAGSRIRAYQGHPRPNDPHCLPSRWRSRLWRWNGSRLVAGPWRRAAGPPRRLPGLPR